MPRRPIAVPALRFLFWTVHLGNWRGTDATASGRPLVPSAWLPFILTAADGDTVFGTFSGQAVPTDDPNVVNYEDPA